MKNFVHYFRAFLAVVLFLWAMAYLWYITFLPEGHTLSKYAEIILGFILGSGLTGMLKFYFSKRSEHNAKENGKKSEKECEEKRT